MTDSELDAIRAKRLVELQQQQQQQQAGSNKNIQSSPEEKQQQQEDMRNTMLSSLLTQEARARLNMIALTKPEKGRMIEDILIQNARRGAFGGRKVPEEQLIGLLEQVSKATEKKTKVNFDRRRAAVDSDSD
ncbi:unnamed protein product [Rotaria socialis]|uniref:Programmed cell death protein 5 n=1 Tax=Rotaria socialis TaxID=392032 RepID=A0A820N282_9BILA|nr:unnamed protein product [Rotaria socialis]CAF4380872.1 unnamed protein product [Rotaria socialis]